MFSNRIKLIASFIDENDKVLDVGTDHALLPIYLIKNNITLCVDGSDISENVLNSAKQNIQKFEFEDRINLILSDGLKSVKVDKYNTLVIAGMGYITIEGILKSSDLSSIKKLIVQSNNHVEDLRRFLNSIGFSIKKEEHIKDKGISYTMVIATKGKQELSEEEYICGIYNPNSKWFYLESIEHIKNTLSQIKGESKKVTELKEKLDIYNDYIVR